MKAFTKVFYLPLLFLMILSSHLFSAATFTQGSTAQELASQIEGVGITITNPTITYGSSSQRGIFSDGVNGAGLEIDRGIILTTMSVAESFTTNHSENFSVNNPNNDDADLLGIDPNAYFNTIVFEFDVTLESNTRLILVDYQFASEEYNEYVGTKFNDSFGFFISGGDLTQTYNIARVVDNQTYVDISNINNYRTVVVNHVNNGTPGFFAQTYPATEAVDYTNSAFFIDNSQNLDGDPATTSPVTVEYDGLTHTLHATLDKLTPGETYHFKMAIADSSDSNLNTGVFVNRISGLKEPSICYDYAYKQNGLYLTEGYDAVRGPFISGDIPTNDPIEVSMYILNTEDSAITATNVTLDLLDINTTQAIYKTESVYVVEPNTLFKTKIDDSALDVSNSYIKNIPITSFNAFEHFYTYFSINPLVLELAFPIKAQINYDLIIPLSSTVSTTIPRSSIIDTEIPICGGGTNVFNPVYGLFNIIENDLYTDSSNYFYNINTQVTKREGSLSIVAIDGNLTTNPNLHNAISNITTVVAVDMLDLKSFHFTGASCSEKENSITDRAWIIIDGTEITPLLTNDVNFYKKARENVAFRISYNLKDDEGELVQLQKLVDNGETRWNVLNFSDLVKTGNCEVGTAHETDPVVQWCSNSGANFNSAMTPSELAVCMECVYGKKTKLICSRDNFAIRPEAFLIQINDQNQTDSNNPLTPPKGLTDNLSGVVTPTISSLDFASGYQYDLDINATNHLDNSASSGYNFHLSTVTGTDATYNWAPKATTIVTDCNDTTPKSFVAKFINGEVDMNSSVPQVGDYRLSLLDTAWTNIDSIQQSHHIAPFYLNGSDCVLNSSNVANIGGLDSLNGCDISSNHDSASQDSNLKYRDINITFHPYRFNMSTINLSRGENNNTTFNANSYIYMSDVSVDESMAFHISGTISAVGYNNQTLSNFTNNCYGQGISLDINASDISGAVAYKSSLNTFDEDMLSNIPLLSGQTAPWVKDINNSLKLNGSWQIPVTSFDKNMLGSIRVVQNMNFDRNLTIGVNPETIMFTTYDANCTTPANCTMSADLINSKKTSGYKDFNRTDNPSQRISLRHYYSRSHASRQRFEGNNGTANIYYETYCFGTVNGNTCDKTILPQGLNSRRTDDIRWYINDSHNVSNDGNVSIVIQKNGINIDANDIVDATDNPSGNPSITTITYDESKGYPYKTTIENNASSWLIYNEDDPTATRNQFSVEFNDASSDWSGVHETDTVTKDINAPQTNRRSMW